MTKREDLMRRAETLRGAACRAQDRWVGMMLEDRAKRLEDKAMRCIADIVLGDPRVGVGMAIKEWERSKR